MNLLKCYSLTDVYCYAGPEDLTWEEANFDFIYEDDGMGYTEGNITVCHVPAQYYDAYVSKFGSSVNVTFQAAPILLTGKTYKQTASKGSKYYTRFVFVKPMSELEGKCKAKFTAIYNFTPLYF